NDLRPVGDHAGRGEALARERVGDRLPDELAQELWVRARLVHGRRLCQIETMSLAVKAGAKKLRSPDPAVLLAWYDRHRRALPWRAPKAGGRNRIAVGSSRRRRQRPTR